jgi:hypothetical protein
VWWIQCNTLTLSENRRGRESRTLKDKDFIITCTEVITKKHELVCQRTQGSSANNIIKDQPLKQLHYDYCTNNVFVDLRFSVEISSPLNRWVSRLKTCWLHAQPKAIIRFVYINCCAHTSNHSIVINESTALYCHFPLKPDNGIIKFFSQR